jgi:hypothetical protein
MTAMLDISFLFMANSWFRWLLMDFARSGCTQHARSQLLESLNALRKRQIRVQCQNTSAQHVAHLSRAICADQQRHTHNCTCSGGLSGAGKNACASSAAAAANSPLGSHGRASDQSMLGDGLLCVSGFSGNAETL